MRPLDLREFAEQLQREGCEWADEILQLLALEEDVAEPYSDLCAELEDHAPPHLKNVTNGPTRTVEWLADRSNMLGEIEEELKKADREGNADAAVKELLGTMEHAEDILEAAGWPGGGDFINGIQALADRPEPLEYDL